MGLTLFGVLPRLDLGCGRGSMIERWLGYHPASIACIDMLPGSLDKEGHKAGIIGASGQEKTWEILYIPHQPSNVIKFTVINDAFGRCASTNKCPKIDFLIHKYHSWSKHKLRVNLKVD